MRQFFCLKQFLFIFVFFILNVKYAKLFSTQSNAAKRVLTRCAIIAKFAIRTPFRILHKITVVTIFAVYTAVTKLAIIGVAQVGAVFVPPRIISVITILYSIAVKAYISVARIIQLIAVIGIFASEIMHRKMWQTLN